MECIELNWLCKAHEKGQKQPSSHSLLKWVKHSFSLWVSLITLAVTRLRPMFSSYRVNRCQSIDLWRKPNDWFPLGMSTKSFNHNYVNLWTSEERLTRNLYTLLLLHWQKRSHRTPQTSEVESFATILHDFKPLTIVV